MAGLWQLWWGGVYGRTVAAMAVWRMWWFAGQQRSWWGGDGGGSKVVVSGLTGAAGPEVIMTLVLNVSVSIPNGREKGRVKDRKTEITDDGCTHTTRYVRACVPTCMLVSSVTFV